MLNYNELKYLATKMADTANSKPGLLAAMGAPDDVIRDVGAVSTFIGRGADEAINLQEKALINYILTGGLGGGIIGGVAGGLGEHLFSKEKEKNYLKSILLGAGAGAALGGVGGGAMQIGPYLEAKKLRDSISGIDSLLGVNQKTSAVKQAVGEITAMNMGLAATEHLKNKYPEAMGYGGTMGIGAAGGAIAGIPTALIAHALFADKKNRGLRDYLKSSLLGALIGGGVGALGGAGYKALGFAEPEMTEGRAARNIQKGLYDYDAGKLPVPSKEEDEKNKDAPERVEKSMKNLKEQSDERRSKIEKAKGLRDQAQKALDEQKDLNSSNANRKRREEINK